MVTGAGPHPIFFGTWRRVGHYSFAPGMTGLRGYPPPTPWGKAIDKAPKWGIVEGRRYSGHYGSQGDAVLRHLDGWTCLAVADYTVDDRPNSHASFCFPGVLTFEQAVAAATEYFPQVVARVGEIREVPNGV